MEVGAELIGMVKTNTKGLCKDTIENLTKDWPGGYYLVLRSKSMLPGTGRLLLSATSIMRGRFYLLLLQTTEGAQRLVSPIYLSILTNLLMLSFALFLVPLLCQKINLILMRLNPTTNQDSLIWHWRSDGLLSVVGCGYVQQLLWE